MGKGNEFEKQLKELNNKSNEKTKKPIDRSKSEAEEKKEFSEFLFRYEKIIENNSGIGILQHDEQKRTFIHILGFIEALFVRASTHEEPNKPYKVYRRHSKRVYRNELDCPEVLWNFKIYY